MYKFNLDLVPFRAAYQKPVALTLSRVAGGQGRRGVPSKA